MQSLPGETGIFAPFALYTIDPKSWGGKAYALRHLGCGFPVHPGGLLATCAHVVADVNSDKEMLVAQHPTEGVCHLIKKVTSHARGDFAVLELDCRFNVVPTAILGTLPLGVQSFSYGYYDYFIDNGEFNIIPQVYTGTITATPTRFKLPLQTKLPFYQLSFPCLPGFSGSPLYSQINDGHALSGMMFGNESSQITERYVSETDIDGSRVIEKSVRIFESGAAHTCDALKHYAKDLGFDLWPQ